MNRLRMLLLAVCACGQGLEGVDDLATSTAELNDTNGLDYNGLGSNGLNSNGLNSNGLNSNGLNSNGLNSNGLNSNGLNSNGLNSNGLAFAAWYNKNPTLNAQVIKYLTKCAMPAGSTLTYAGVTYPGAFGLAPAWATRAPTLDEQQWVSACMLAHVNAKGLSVVVSFRAPGKIGYSATEAAAYPVPEGAFWGNLFSPTVSKNVCSVISKTQVASPDSTKGPMTSINTSDLRGRTCSTISGLLLGEVLACGMTLQAPCRNATCTWNPFDSAGFTSCKGVTQVVSTYIPPYCGDGTCSGSETTVSCPGDCPLPPPPVPTSSL